jgi:hypothetical protein
LGWVGHNLPCFAARLIAKSHLLPIPTGPGGCGWMCGWVGG